MKAKWKNRIILVFASMLVIGGGAIAVSAQQDAGQQNLIKCGQSV